MHLSKSIFLGLLFTMLYCKALAQLPKVSSGKILRLEKFASKYVDTRNVDVWLPANYSTKKKYAVLYMHDGQMLFDSTITWNKQEWKVDETLNNLVEANAVKNTIVVGIWNNGDKRFAEYFPENILQYVENSNDTIGFANRLKNYTPQANNYLKFIAEELKPRVDSTFNTYKNKENTFIGGSSMGGLISLYAICQYPKVFGGAACLSTHLPVLFTNINNHFPNLINSYLKNNLPNPSNHKIYFDYGTATLDSLYKPYQRLVDITMKQKGYTSKNWITKEFQGEDHSEKAWSRRLHIPLQFLLTK